LTRNVTKKLESFHELLLLPIFHYSVWGVISAPNLTSLKRDDRNVAPVCVQETISRQNSPAITATAMK